GARLRRAPANGPARQAAGSRSACSFSCFRRGELHHRADASRGRRHGFVGWAQIARPNVMEDVGLASSTQPKTTHFLLQAMLHRMNCLAVLLGCILWNNY